MNDVNHKNAGRRNSFETLASVFTTVAEEEKKQVEKYQAHPVTQRQQSRKELVMSQIAHEQERRVLVMVSIVTGVFIICWLPFVTYVHFILYHCKWISTRFYEPSLWFGFLNSTINPFIYAQYAPGFKNHFGKLLIVETFSKFKNKIADTF